MFGPLLGLFVLTSTEAAATPGTATATLASIAPKIETEITPKTEATIDLAPREHGSPEARIATFRDAPITIDGAANDPTWSETRWYGGFVQTEPSEGSPASEETRFKIAHDDDALYLFVDALDSTPAKISGHLTRRDADSTSDWIHLWLDPIGAGRTSYRFSVNAAGVKQDARIVEGAILDDLDWNAVWSAAVATSTKGWTVEMRIPLSELRYTEGHPHWVFEVGRDLVRRRERSYFSAVPKGASRPMQYFGRLAGVGDIPGKIDAAITPYLSGSVRHDIDRETTWKPNAGADGHLGLGSSLVLDLTVNPDFAQVEADPSELNLTTTETFFTEKRPFFVAGADVLSFGLGWGDGDLSRHTLFYSRRVGAEQVLGAAKLTGRSTDGWSIGALEAVFGGTSSTADTAGEPVSNAAVLRATQDYSGGEGRIGLMATHLYRNLGESERSELLEHAASFGADLDHHIGHYTLQLRLYGSHVTGTREALVELQESAIHNYQRPDADHVDVDPNRTSLTGWGLTAVASKMDGKHWRGAIGAEILSPGFEPNPLGYLPVADRQIFFGWFQIREDEPSKNYQNYSINFNILEQRTFNEDIGLSGNINANLTAPFYWNFFAGGGRDQAYLSPGILRGGPALKLPGGSFGWIGFESDKRKWLSGLIEVGGFTGDGFLTHDWYIFTRAILKPTSWLEVQIEPQFSQRYLDWQYVDPINDRPTLARIERDTFTFSLRLNWTFTPELSLQYYASPFFSSGDYSNYRYVTSPRADRYGDRFTPVAESDQPTGLDRELHFSEVRSNFVLRWEYTLGSTAYFVWSYGQTSEEPAGRRTPFDNFGPLFSQPADIVLLVKVAHRLDL